jgi:steroid delta-isomerase-like uncharacterized protein
MPAVSGAREGPDLLFLTRSRWSPWRPDFLSPAGASIDLAGETPLRARGRWTRMWSVSLEENKALARRYYDEVLTGRQHQLLDELLGAGFVSHVSGGPEVGIEVYAAAVAATHAAFADLVVTVLDQVAEADKVVTRWSATGRQTGSFAGVPATGRLLTVTGIHIHRVRSGRLVEHWEELDILGALRQLGAISM